MREKAQHDKCSHKKFKGHFEQRLTVLHREITFKCGTLGRALGRNKTAVEVHDLFANRKPYSSLLLSLFVQAVKHRKYFFSFLWIKANPIIDNGNQMISNIRE